MAIEELFDVDKVHEISSVGGASQCTVIMGSSVGMPSRCDTLAVSAGMSWVQGWRDDARISPGTVPICSWGPETFNWFSQFIWSPFNSSDDLGVSSFGLLNLAILNLFRL